MLDNIDISQSTRKKTREGYLQGIATVTCVGVQQYSGAKLLDNDGIPDGMPIDRNQIYNVYRPESVVFDNATIESLQMKPITNNHPPKMLDTTDTSIYQVGMTGEKVQRQGYCLAVPYTITGADAIRDLEAGKCQVSLGYAMDSPIVAEIGVFDGVSYSLRWTSPMIINHLAIVDTGTCNNDARILDNSSVNKVKKTGGLMNIFNKNNKGAESMDGLDMDSIVSKVVEQIQPQIQELIGSDDFVSKLAEAVATKISTGDDANTADMTSDDTTVQDDDPVDQSPVADVASSMDALDTRLSIIENAKLINPNIKYNGKSNKDIMIEALGINASNKSEDYIMGMMDSVVEKRKVASKDISGMTDGASSYQEDARCFTAMSLSKN